MTGEAPEGEAWFTGDVIRRFGGRYSVELGIDLSAGKAREVFKWFLAALLFGARISEKLAARTYRAFAREGLLSPQRILQQGWDGLVAVLDAGGYARYDFKTATKLLDICASLLERYDGDLVRLHAIATSPGDLEERIHCLGKGIGPVTLGIFLRELRGVWSNAQPPLAEPALQAANALGFLSTECSDPRKALQHLLRIWTKDGRVVKDFPDFESALVRAGLAFRRQKHFGRDLG